jgi:sigma-B regulation protein RsbU (phosphoserine phosphatase)
MTTDAPPLGSLPDVVRELLDDLQSRFPASLSLWALEADGRGACLYPEGTEAYVSGQATAVRRLTSPDGPEIELEVRGDPAVAEPLADTVASSISKLFELGQEIRFFTHELSERYEEINLLYSISETLGSILRLDDAARAILGEVTDVLGARRGSLWVYDADQNLLRLTASVGEDGLKGPLRADDPSVTAQVFREGRSMIASPEGSPVGGAAHPTGGDSETLLSVPIRYTPPAGESRTVGVINLIGRRHGGRFTASDQKLLSAIASQVGAALENNRLIQESLAAERVSAEMALAHDLQMKLLPAVETFDGADVAARVKPAESVGGDFYHLFKLPAGKVGVMIGDVSSHGLPAALIMALSMSAASIYASEFGNPGKVLRHMDDALRGELETTEMYLTLFYGVIDPAAQQLVYSNAGHPHAFVVHQDGTRTRLGATDPPVGIAGEDSYREEEVAWTPPDDILVLFTDGLSDPLSEDGTGEHGEEIVLNEVVARRGGRAKDIVHALFELSGVGDSSIPSDDRTAIILRP